MYIGLIVFVLLAAAVLTDFLYDRIFNEWILITLAVGLSCAAWREGPEGLRQAILSMTVLFLLLYPLYRIGGIGAGDVKLLAVTGTFFTVKDALYCLAAAFVIGAVFSLFKMLRERNFLQRAAYLLSYLYEVLRCGEWKLYGQDIQDERKRKEGKIHFALPVFIGVILIKGGIYWKGKF